MIGGRLLPGPPHHLACGSALCSNAAHAVDLHDSLHAVIRFSDRFQAGFDLVEVLGDGIELLQLKIQFTFPQFVDLALVKWLPHRIELLSTGVPGLGSAGDLDALVVEDRANGALRYLTSRYRSRISLLGT